MTPDAWLLLSARAMRLFATGLVSIVLTLYLAELDARPAIIGAVFASALAGGTVATLVATAIGDRIGRRRLLMLSSALMAVGGAAFALTDIPWLLVVVAFFSMVSPSGGETGSSLALEQSALAEVVSPSHRTGLFAWANLVASAATAVGSLAAGLTSIMQQLGVGPLDSYKLLLWAYAFMSMALLLLFAKMSPAVEARRPSKQSSGTRPGLRPASRGIVARFALLQGFNSFAAAFVTQAFLAYWFHVRFGVDPGLLGPIFFLTNVVSALSYIASARIAARIGLVNTMVFTHLPSNLLLVLIPAMPTLLLAATVLVMRNALSQMDRPARDSHTVGIVASEERTAAAGITRIAMDAGAAAGMSVAGVAAQFIAPGTPFVIAGTLRILYNAGLFVSFRHVKTPEERRQEPS